MKDPQLFQTLLDDCLQGSAKPAFLKKVLTATSPETWIWMFSQWDIPVTLRRVNVRMRKDHFPWSWWGRETVTSSLAIEWEGWFWSGWTQTWVRGEKTWLSALRTWLQSPEAGNLSPFHGFTAWRGQTELFGLRLTSEGRKNVAVLDFAHTPLRQWRVGEAVETWITPPVRPYPPMVVEWVETTGAILAAGHTQRQLETHLAEARPAGPSPTPRTRRL
jgi:hypothetical protein